MKIFSALAFGLAFLGRLANEVTEAPSPKAACLQARDVGLWGPDCGYPEPEYRGYGGPAANRGPGFRRARMRGRDSAGTDASGWRSKDPYSLYRALNGTERAELEKLASDYNKFEDRMGKKYHIHFCEAGGNDCEKKSSYGRSQNFEDAFEGGCLNSADHEKLSHVETDSGPVFELRADQVPLRREFDGRARW
jgi:hypothetical protein